MIPHSTKVVLFGDQTVDPYPLIKQLSRQSVDSLTLRIFFRDTHDAVHQELAKSEYSDHSSFPRFDSVLSLAETYSESGKSNVAIATVLHCIAQLGLLLVQQENDGCTFDTSSSSRTYYLGLCTGMLPAVSAAVATSTGQLLELALGIVCISLRLGLEVNHRSAQIEQSCESWSTVVSGISVQEQKALLDQFHQEHAMSKTKMAYISAEADLSATISGPPSTVASLLAFSEPLREARKIKLSISGAFHARHLGDPDVDKILGSSSFSNYRIRKDAAIISTSSGEPIGARNLREVLHHIVMDVLREPLCWSNIVRQIVSRFGNTSVSILSAGHVHAADSLRREMNTAGIDVVESAEMQPLRTTSTQNNSSDIAIVGFAGRIPGGETLEEIWKVLEDGRDLHRKVPKDRFDIDTHCDPSGKTKNTSVTSYGCFLDRPGFFDARLFNMSPREAAQTDPAQRLLLLTTYEALEMAGYTPDGSPSTASERIGTFFGQTIDDYREANASQDIDMYYATGGIRAFGPGRLNYHFKWEGPSYSVDTACSSSAVAIQMAVSSLLTRECDTAVAGGTNVLTGSDMFSGLSRGGFLSPTGSCKTFDDNADGYCRADGVGSVVLKRVADAIADGDNIQAVIKSIATNHSAHAVSITHPHAETQQKLIRRVLREANVKPDEIDYVEMHGTGTQAGDATEFVSVINALGNRTTENPLYVGAVKANIGHAEAAAGTNSLLKIVMMLRKNTIPPHVGIKGRINDKFPSLDKLNVCIDTVRTTFQTHTKGGGKRRILLNNFNATGGNTSMILEDPPNTFVEGRDPRTAHLVAVSARTPNSFKQNVERLLNYVESNPEIRLQDLSYTTTARRMHHNFRKAYSVENLGQLIESMKKDLASTSEPSPITETPSVIFVFTGQGSQYLGMGRQLFKTSAYFRQSILEFDNICIRQGMPSFKRIIDASPDETAPSPCQVQLSLISIELAIAFLWQSWGMKPCAVIGHSLGEYAALCVAGVFSVTDTLYLVGSRAKKMENKCTANSHAMLAVNSSAESIEQILSTGQLPSCEIACFNGPSSTVVSGTRKHISSLEGKLDAIGVKTTLLEVPFAFHSTQMDPILDDIRAIAKNIEFLKPTVPFASTLLAALVRDRGVISADYLTRQVRRPVDFQGALDACKSEGIADDRTLWIEVGPHPLCHGMIRSTLGMSPTKALPTLRRDEDCWSTTCQSIAKAFNSGVTTMWSEYQREFRGALRLLELPSYAFDLRNYWIQYEGDWALRKGDKAITSSPPQGFFTTCLQRVENECYTEDSASVEFSSQLAEPKLNAAVRGHIVNGIGLCPSSVYADVAFTAAYHIFSRMAQSDSIPALDLSGMEVFRPLIVHSADTSQSLKVSGSKQSGDQVVKISISSLDDEGSREHAHCTVIYSDGQKWREEWQRNAYLVQWRIDQLVQPVNTGDIHRIRREMLYKQFQRVVKYSKEYHAIEEIFMDCDLYEAAANIRFQPGAGNGEFLHSPYWIDTVAHLAGFVLNVSYTTPEDVVYISHGWQSFRITAPLSDKKRYRGYVRMRPRGTQGIMAGDCYIFDDDEIVILCKGLKFQKMKRTVLHSLLSVGSEQPTQKPVETQRTLQRCAVATKNHAASITGGSLTGLSNILETIASEVGVETCDLGDNAKLIDLGVDSLLTISILSKLRPLTGLDLPSSLFLTYPTVVQLKTFFLDRMALRQGTADDEESDATSKSTKTPSSSQILSTSTTPPELDTAAILVSIIASEVGIDTAELQVSTRFADLGVDSLLTISILGSFKTQTGMSLSPSFFQQHSTLADAQTALGVASTPQNIPNQTGQPPEINQARSSQPFKSVSVLLQGRISPDQPALFLLPDGAGSLFSYISLPALPSGLPIYGLDSPFHNSPIDYTISFTAVASLYVDEIRRVQPRGPYMLGGWSLGGIHAYEVARQLIAQGEDISSLIMIDSPCPGTLPPLPSPTLDLLERAGVFEGLNRAAGPITERTRLHFLGSVRALENYNVEPLPADRKLGRVTVVWAQEGVLEGQNGSIEEPIEESSKGGIAADMNKAKQWLMGKRESFGPSGWDKLTGAEVECHVVGGNHFSIMFPPKIDSVAAAIAEGVVPVSV